MPDYCTYFIGAYVVLLVTATPMIAQVRLPITWAIRADNDYFNFWQSARARPDEEYTQGAEFSAAWSGRSVLPVNPLRRMDPCTVEISLAQPCIRLRLAIGQEMYTPSVDSPHLLPGQRPYAGWLYARFSESIERGRGVDAFTATLGVTGAPSLAEATQALWHPWFNFRSPLGWAGQLPFEPDVAVTWTRARELISPASPAARSLHLAPYGGATIGTLATDVAVGGSMTAGFNPREPWQPAARPAPAHHFALYLAVAAQSKLVLRNLFLDGTTFRSSSSVPRIPVVGQLSGGVGVSIGRIRAEWTVIRLGREYTTQLMGHTYSQLALRVE
jgi:lipid A 3-O-deacylase